MACQYFFQKNLFQSTLPVWGATLNIRPGGQVQLISIHAPRVGSDPHRLSAKANDGISIHAPRVGSDWSLLA